MAAQLNYSPPGEVPLDYSPPIGARVNYSPPVDVRPRRARRPSPSLAGPMGAQPLISCIMPTRQRPEFVAQAISYFRRQDYPVRELVIACRDDSDLPGAMVFPDVRIVRTGETSIGGMRNACVRAARGEIIAHWDDDDWHGPLRLSRQAEPIVRGAADITGLDDILFLSLSRGEFWKASPDLFARLFVENVAGGTMMFRRGVWELHGPYPPISLREDAELLERAVGRGARLCRLGGRDDYVYVRHGGNTWVFAEGRYLDPEGWAQTGEPAALASDRGFYFGRAARASADQPGGLVSCIMPTRNRRAFVPGAIAQFLRQDHDERELIVIDDGEQSVADLIPADPSIRYSRLKGPISIGAKRNLACELARGDIIAHWDDDDWRAPQWLSAQVATLTAEGADLCGLARVFHYAPAQRAAWRYAYGGGRAWVGGGTLCYRRQLWRCGPFPEISVGEDNAFVWSALDKRIAINPRSELYVAIIHPDNSSPKITTHHWWRPIRPAFVEQLMRDSGA